MNSDYSLCSCYRESRAHPHQLLAGIEAARSRFAGFWGSGCDCFVFYGDTMSFALGILLYARRRFVR